MNRSNFRVVVMMFSLGLALIACGKGDAPVAPPSPVAPSEPAATAAAPAAPAAPTDTAAAAPVPSAFALVNPSFEQQMTGWWHWSSIEKASEAFTEGGEAKDGAFRLVEKMNNPSGELLSMVVQNIPNPQGKRIRVKGFIKSGTPLENNSWAYIGVEFWRGGEKVGVKDSPTLRGSFPWTEAEVVADIPPDGVEEARVILVLRGEQGSKGSALFDHLSVVFE